MSYTYLCPLCVNLISIPNFYFQNLIFIPVPPLCAGPYTLAHVITISAVNPQRGDLLTGRRRIISRENIYFNRERVLIANLAELDVIQTPVSHLYVKAHPSNKILSGFSFSLRVTAFILETR